MNNTANKVFNPSLNYVKLMNSAEQQFDSAKYELSIQYYTMAMQQLNTNTDIVYALYMRGCAYKEMGNVGKAREDWQQAQSFGLEHPMGVDLVTMALEQV